MRSLASKCKWKIKGQKSWLTTYTPDCFNSYPWMENRMRSIKILKLTCRDKIYQCSWWKKSVIAAQQSLICEFHSCLMKNLNCHKTTKALMWGMSTKRWGNKLRINHNRQTVTSTFQSNFRTKKACTNRSSPAQVATQAWLMRSSVMILVTWLRCH